LPATGARLIGQHAHVQPMSHTHRSAAAASITVGTRVTESHRSFRGLMYPARLRAGPVYGIDRRLLWTRRDRIFMGQHV